MESAAARLASLERQKEEFSKILALFRDGVLLLDEVDLILHPLKSELNFPKGEKFGLDASGAGERWSLPIHLMDAVFFAENNDVSTYEARGAALDVLNRISKVISDGYRVRAFQRLPHITLLNLDYYDQELRPIVAEWAFLWLQKNHLHGIDRIEAIKYMLSGAAARSDGSTKCESIRRALKNESNDDVQRKCLEEALMESEAHELLTDSVYELEEAFELGMFELNAEGSRLEEEISNISAQIKEAEFPRDDSLDNAVVVWVSPSFGLSQKANASGSKTRALRSLHSLCSELEESGLTVKRCESVDEADARVRELRSSGRLRCLVCGGGEGVAGCDVNCDESHDSNCLKCGRHCDSHNGHNCPDGKGRGSWIEDSEGASEDAREQDEEYLYLIESLLKPSKGEPLPEDRAVVFTGHNSQPNEQLRNSLWSHGVFCTEDDLEFKSFVDSLEPWGVAETINDESDETEIPIGDASKPAPLVKQESAGTRLLRRLRHKLEALEEQKADHQAVEESKRVSMRSAVTDKYYALRTSLTKKIVKLNEILESFDQPPEQDFLSKHGSNRSGVDCAIALAALKSGAAHHESFEAIRREVRSLEHTALAAKVMAFVSLPQKKLLNLAYDWLRTFLPHCLKKVNRVSFGLLSESDCERVLMADPLVPRSRLKLAVPFVGKDVPSTSSEFAHPDVIIGLTVLAYRYSGLRRTDYDDLVDSLVSEFHHEIGPSKDRASSKRHELWVKLSGGSIRGIKSKEEIHNKKRKDVVDADDDDEEEREVVMLKFLQTSNEEQMDKLFNLWKLQPHVVHFYLQKFVFPNYMRSQRKKIMASGQAIGGDMLFGRRVGFSGTPSDLLPKELGNCIYETGDDGKMLSTVLDPNIASFERFDSSWNVETLLDRVATSTNPQFNALIDTGALVTGYSNKEVAEELLQRGLPWCDGVVFLNEEDKQRVLVRDTNRVVPADQCGVPLSRRFAFYDQIHTTGMDIQHVVNATAVVTLGKDMVFRDYVQGAFRMRGIGRGQKIRVFVIPEVSELVKRELKLEKESEDSRVLIDVVSWLVVNSMRSEQTQWSMLCLQNLANVYRKNAFQSILSKEEHYSPNSNAINAESKQNDIELFEESIDFSLEASVPDPVPFVDKLTSMLEEHDDFVFSESQKKIAVDVIEEVKLFGRSDGRTMDKLDSEQEREQEQEQEKEVRQKREQQVEVERFVDREYSRSEEKPTSWHISELSKAPLTLSIATKNSSKSHPFYPLRDFQVRYQAPLKFPSFLAASRNYFNPNWHGLRRLKNVVMILEYAPDASRIRIRNPESTLLDAHLDSRAREALRKAFRLLTTSEVLTIDELESAVFAAADVKIDETTLKTLFNDYSSGDFGVELNGLEALLTSGKLRVVHDNRYFVAISLAEAETIQRVLHVRAAQCNDAESSGTQMALRYAQHDEGIVFDASDGWKVGSTPKPNTPAYMSRSAHASLRFLDCHSHFSEKYLNVLVRSLQNDPPYERERFFVTTIGCRRRLARDVVDTPLAKVFTFRDEWSVLKSRSQAVFIRKALKRKQLTFFEAFTCFDADDNGVLSPSEFFGALRFLDVPDLTIEDVVDMIEAADTNRDGVIDYREYVDMLNLMGDSHDDDDDDVVGEDDSTSPSSKKNQHQHVKVEPYGAERLREAIATRKRVSVAREREERAKRVAHQQSLDIKVFEDELRESRKRKGGQNPSVKRNAENRRVVEFRFTQNKAPIRLVPTGKQSFCNMREQATRKIASSKLALLGKMKCPVGHALSQDYQYWSKCSACGQESTKWACHSCSGSGFHICDRCYSRFAEEHKKRSQDLSEKVTYLKCSAGGFFSLQIPSFKFADEDETHTPSTTVSETENVGTETEEPPTRQFTMTFEFRCERMPVRGNAASLVRFFPASFGRSRKRHDASAYVEPKGRVVAAFEKNNSSSIKGSVLKPSGPIVEFPEHLTDAALDKTFSDEKKKKKKKNSSSSVELTNLKGLIKANKWSVVTLVADASAGVVKAYVDGCLSSTTSGLSEEDVTLRHSLIVLGGGKQAQARGGHVRRVFVHEGLLSEEEIRALSKRCFDEMLSKSMWLSNFRSKHSDLIFMEAVSTGRIVDLSFQEQFDAKTLKKQQDLNSEFEKTVLEPFRKRKEAAGEGEFSEKEPKDSRLKLVTPSFFDCGLKTLKENKGVYRSVVLSLDDIDFQEFERSLDPNESLERSLDPNESRLDLKEVAPPGDDASSKKNALDLRCDSIKQKLYELSEIVKEAQDPTLPKTVVVLDLSEQQESGLFSLRERVAARWQGRQTWYDGEIDSAHPDGTYDVKFDDGDFESSIAPDLIRRLSGIKQQTKYQTELAEIATKLGFEVVFDESEIMGLLP